MFTGAASKTRVGVGGVRAERRQWDTAKRCADAENGRYRRSALVATRRSPWRLPHHPTAAARTWSSGANSAIVSQCRHSPAQSSDGEESHHRLADRALQHVIQAASTHRAFVSLTMMGIMASRNVISANLSAIVLPAFHLLFTRCRVVHLLLSYCIVFVVFL